MTPRGTLALLGVLALLVVYLSVVDRPSSTTVDEEPLLTAPAAQVTRVEITWPDARLLAVRRDGGWRDQDERPLPSGLVDDLLAALGTVRPMETLASTGPTASEYGFGPRTTSLSIGAGGNPLLHLEMGDRNPSRTGVYVRRSGSVEVLLVGALLHWELEKLRAAASR